MVSQKMYGFYWATLYVGFMSKKMISPVMLCWNPWLPLLSPEVGGAKTAPSWQEVYT